MKKVTMILFAVGSLLFASCGQRSEGTHTHEDGTTHDHASDTTKQEEFNAADSADQHIDTASHSHPHN